MTETFINDLRAKPGYLDHVLHRVVQPDARFRFVNVAHWASAEAWRAAHDDGFRALWAGRNWRATPRRPRCSSPCTPVPSRRGK
ncbi:MAG TPA: antibiotic biosynthesis monooxygenase [Pseudonocardia sp.]